MYIISGVYWDKGERPNNQDSLILEQVLTKRGRVVLAAVCDGIGGLAAGEMASGYACEKLKECFYREILPMIKKRRSRRRVARCFHRCFYESYAGLRKYAEGEVRGLGTTVSVLLLWKRYYLVAHLGDSRVYQISKKRLWQLTEDHRRDGNILTKCLSSYEYRQPHIRSGRVGRRVGFLLCSDGFYHFPEEELLVQLCNPSEITGKQTIVKRLRELAVYGLRRGEQDNMAAIYLVCTAKKLRNGYMESER